jgi:hypothetical protein
MAKELATRQMQLNNKMTFLINLVLVKNVLKLRKNK